MTRMKDKTFVMFCFSQNPEYPEAPIKYTMKSSVVKVNYQKRCFVLKCLLFQNCSSTDGKMPDERQWFYFVYASLGVYFGGLFFVLIYSAIKGNI